jgi:hypothetical protein
VVLAAVAVVMLELLGQVVLVTHHQHHHLKEITEDQQLQAHQIMELAAVVER